MTKAEKAFLALFFCTLVVGIWHALPQTSVVGDESTFVGGVLRAMQAHTPVPNIDSSYTVSFFASYVLMLPVVVAAVAMHGFSVAAAVHALNDHYDWLYLVPRLASLLASLGIAWVLLLWAKKEGHGLHARVLAVALALSPIIVVTIMHTGKMWALSVFFILWADYLCMVIIKERERTASRRWFCSPLFWCPAAAFLAVSNFPFAFIALGAPALAYLSVRKDKASRTLLLRSSVLWFLVFCALTLLNLHGWTAQDAATPPGSFVPLSAFFYQLALLPAMIPFLLLGIAFHLDRIKNYPLFYLLLGQMVAFLALVALRAPWVLGSTDYLRYYFLVAILFGALLIVTSLHRKTPLIVLALLSAVFWGKTLYLLAVPTTYNQAADWVAIHLAPQKVTAYNAVGALDLPRNAASYSLLKSNLCASRCQQELADPESPYRYLLISGESDPARSPAQAQVQYLVSSGADTSSSTLAASFGASQAGDYYAVNHRLGIYDPRYLLLPRLGEPIHVYERK